MTKTGENNNIIFEDFCVKIPLYNKNKEIVEYIIIDREDYDKVILYTWNLSINTANKKEYKAAYSKINNKTTNLSHYIYKKPEGKNIIDHINNNALDNRKCNLHETTKSHNSQNRKKYKINSSSKYLGVTFEKNKWRAKSTGTSLGSFKNEIDAAIIYDKYTYIKFGKNASTNNLVLYEDVKNLTFEDILPIKAKRELPENIYLTTEKNYIASINFKKMYRSIAYKNIEDAQKHLDIFKKEIELIKKQDKFIHNNKEITRDINNNAVIHLRDINGNIVDSAIVDDDLWHSLSNFGWNRHSINEKYIQATINKKSIKIHRYIMNQYDDDIKVDHIDNNPLNNKISNLRLATIKQNGYNKKKSEKTANTYKGVRIINNIYRAVISKDGKFYDLGSYENEIQAAIAYNLKAKILFGNFAKLNTIDIEEDLQNKYIKEIENYKKKYVNIYRGVSKINKKYKAQISKNKIIYYLGLYDTEEEAVIAYNLKSFSLNGENAYQNELNIDIETYNKLKAYVLKNFTENKITL